MKTMKIEDKKSLIIKIKDCFGFERTRPTIL